MQTAATTQPTIRASRVDATTRTGFLEIAEAFGRPAAHRARVALIREQLETGTFIRWHKERVEAALRHAEFERDFEAANPVTCQLMREAGMGY